MEDLSKLNLSDISIHFSPSDFNNDFIKAMNIFTQYLIDNNVTINNVTNIHLCHRKNLVDNDSLFYIIKRKFPNNKIYWWHSMEMNNYRELMLNNFAKLSEPKRAIFIFNKEIMEDSNNKLETKSNNLLNELEMCKNLEIPILLIK